MKYIIQLLIIFILFNNGNAKNIVQINTCIIKSVKENVDNIHIEKLYVKLIKKSKLKGNGYFRLANYYAKIGSMQNSEKYYIYSIKNSPYYYYIQNNEALNKIYYSNIGENNFISNLSSEQIKRIDSVYNAELQKRNWLLDSNALNGIISIQETDNSIRKKMSQAYANKDSFLFRSLFDSLKKNQPYYDSINYIRVDSLIKKYNWLDFSNIGYEGATIFWTVLQHVPNKYKKKYLSKYKKSAFKGNSSIGKYTNFLDRYLFFNKKKCIYTPQPYSKTASTNSTELKYSKMRSPRRLNIRRLKIGLPFLQK